MDLSFSTDQPSKAHNKSSLNLSNKLSNRSSNIARYPTHNHTVQTPSLEMPEQQCNLLHDVNCISSIIMTAKKRELQTLSLKTLLSNTVVNLHPSIVLPEQETENSLSDFVYAYIEHVPHFFEVMITTAFESGLDTLLVPPLKAAIDFFITPSTLDYEARGLDELLSAAFFAQRVFEELNDYYQLNTGTAVVYVEMTTANLIIHNIIGEKFANELEVEVQKATQKLLSPNPLVDSETFQQHLIEKDEHWDGVWQHWSDLFAVKNLKLDLNK